MENLFNPFSYNVRLLKKLVAILALPFILKASKSPNFVLVYMDDLGWAETSVEMIKGREDTRSDFMGWSSQPATHPPLCVLLQEIVCSME
jgi:hypothetical protein